MQMMLYVFTLLTDCKKESSEEDNYKGLIIVEMKIYQAWAENRTLNANRCQKQPTLVAKSTH